MKFNELCDLVLLGEADYDSLTGKAKVFSISDESEEIILGIDLNDVKELIRKTTLPFTKEYLASLVLEDLTDYLPAETPDLKKMLKRNIWSKFDDSEKKSERAAAILFAWLKKKKLIKPGIPKKEFDDEDQEPSEKDLSEIEKELGRTGNYDIETITKQLQGGGEYESRGISRSDIGKLGGMSPRQSAYEDESEWY